MNLGEVGMAFLIIVIGFIMCGLSAALGFVLEVETTTRTYAKSSTKIIWLIFFVITFCGWLLLNFR